MKTVSVHDLPAMLAQVLAWAKAGEEVRVLPNLEQPLPEAELPGAPVQEPKPFDWSKSVALTMDRSQMRAMTAEETLEMIHDSRGEW